MDDMRCPWCGCHLHTIRVGDRFAVYCPNVRCVRVTGDGAAESFCNVKKEAADAE